MDPSHLLISEGIVDAGCGFDRFPQWSVQETRELLLIRSELDSTFMETKRNKPLWEAISTKMKERGYNRSGDQCKSKWKNLVTRYKGCDTMEQGPMQQFPFYDELQAIFTNRMQRLLWMEAEGVGGSRKREMKFDSDDDESDAEKASGSSKTKKKKKKKKKGIESSSGQCNPEDTNSGVISNLKEILEEYMKQEMQTEMRWMEWYKAKEEERRMKEMEWRQTMEALEKERTMLYERWREREEQRSMREEDRAQRRDALVTALLNKLRSQDL